MEFSSFEGGITFHLSDVQSSYTLQQKSVANVHLLMLISYAILCISSLKMSFHPDRCYQTLISTHKHSLLIEHIHHLASSHRTPLAFTLDICLLMFH